MIKLNRFLIASVFSFSLMGCSNLGPALDVLTGNTVASTAPVVAMDAEKGLIIAHLAYNSIGDAILVAVNTKLLHGENAAKVKVLYDKAGDALIAADIADKAANTSGIIEAVKIADEAIAQVKLILNSAK